jgi:uncharacterized cupredoxin-like copper-binding protein
MVVKAGITVVIALALLGSSCSSGGAISVRLKEYSVEGPADVDVSGSSVTFRVSNDGQIEHEFDVLRTSLRPDDLPLDDARVATDGRGVELVRKTGRIRAGGSATLVVRLRPGPYVLICNVPGHYQSGMRTALQAL